MLIFFSSYSSNGQYCNTSNDFPNIDYVTPLVNEQNANYGISTFNFYNSNIRVKVFFHIVRKSDKTGARSESLLDNIIIKANQAFASSNITLVKGGFDFIDNDTYANSYSNGLFTQLTATNAKSDAIDIYLIPDQAVKNSRDGFGDPNGIGGSAGSIISKRLVIPWILIEKNSIYYNVLAHELGHCLNLFHTHQSTTSYFLNRKRNDIFSYNSGAELVDGTNSTTSGDFVTDTPSDPFGLLVFNLTNLDFTNPACNSSACSTNSTFSFPVKYYNNQGQIQMETLNFTTTDFRDANNGTYSPNLRNIMSYATPSCLSEFSQNQGYRMRAALLSDCTFRDIVERVQGVGTLGEITTSGSSSSVTFPDRTFSVIGQGTGTTNGNWTITPGISLVSGSLTNSSSITVRGNNNYPSGRISVTLTNSCGTTTYTKDITNDPLSSSTGSCTTTYTEGQFLFPFYGENIYAHLCGTKRYVTTSAGTGGTYKPRHWLEAASYPQASCFEQDDPRLAPGGCSGTTGGGTGTGGTGTADLTESGTASDDGANNPFGEGEAQAFDNTSNTKWLVFSSTGNIAYDFANEDAYVVTRYTVASANDEPARDPKTWNLEGSNDGSTWTTLNSQNNQSFGNRFEVKSYEVTNSTSYKRYRLNVTSNNGSGYLQIGEIQMFGGGTPPPPPPPPSGGCSFTDGQFLLTYQGETIEAKFCGSILYARATWGAWKHPNWLRGAGMNSTTADCFATSNPGCGASGRMSAIAIDEPVGEINLYPNPTTGKIKIVFSLSKDENVWFNLYDIQGKSLDLKDYEGKAGRNMMEYDLQNFPTGAYFINVQSSEKREILKVIKVD